MGYDINEYSKFGWEQICMMQRHREWGGLMLVMKWWRPAPGSLSQAMNGTSGSHPVGSGLAAVEVQTWHVENCTAITRLKN